MTWRELWRSTVNNLKSWLGLSPPPPSPAPAPKRKPRALTGPVGYADPTDTNPQTIDLTPTRSIPPPTSPLRTRKEPKVPAHIAQEVAAFAAANKAEAEERFTSSNRVPAVDMVWPRQALPEVAQSRPIQSNVTEADRAQIETAQRETAQRELEIDPVDSGSFEPEGDAPYDDGYGGNHGNGRHDDHVDDSDNMDERRSDEEHNDEGNNEEDEEGVALTTLLESLLFVAAEPVTPSHLARTLDQPLEMIERGLSELADYYQRSLRGLRLQRFNGKVQLVTAAVAAPFIENFLNLDNSTRLSAPALETLAVVAYRQPVTRAQIEAVRGVDCAGVLRSLVQRGLVAEMGRAESAGRPILYGVTELFMQHFGLMEMGELPPLEEVEADQLWAATEEETLEQPQPDTPRQDHPRRSKPPQNGHT